MTCSTLASFSAVAAGPSCNWKPRARLTSSISAIAPGLSCEQKTWKLALGGGSGLSCGRDDLAVDIRGAGGVGQQPFGDLTHRDVLEVADAVPLDRLVLAKEVLVQLLAARPQVSLLVCTIPQGRERRSRQCRLCSAVQA